MAWTGTVIAAQKTQGQVVWTVEITEPVKGTFRRTFTANTQMGDGTPSAYVSWLKQVVVAWATDIDSIYNAADVIIPGSSIDFNVVITPTDPLYTALVNNITLIRRIERAIAVGIDVGVNGTTALANAKANASNTLQAHPEWIAVLDFLVRG